MSTRWAATIAPKMLLYNLFGFVFALCTLTHTHRHTLDHTQTLKGSNKAAGGKFVNYFGQIETRIVQADSNNCR